MTLKILLPPGPFLDRKVTKLTAEAPDGFFTLLPAHIDYVSSLVPGILYYTDENGSEEFCALDEGILVKCGEEVLVSARHAVEGENLEELHRTVEEQFKILSERERKSRSATAHMEANIIWRFIELGER